VSKKVGKQRRLRQPPLAADRAVAVDELSWDEAEGPLGEKFV
jgi:hypothetical protein